MKRDPVEWLLILALAACIGISLWFGIAGR